MIEAIFLDRDGTIIEHVHHLADKADVRLIPGAADAIKKLRSLGMSIVVVTNQSVVGRGQIDEQALDEIHQTLRDQLEAEGASIDGIYWCGHVPAVRDQTVVEHADRKPGPGMFNRAADELGIDLTRSWMIGDSISDTQAGRNAKCRGTFLVRTGLGAMVDGGHDSIDYDVQDIAEAADRIVALRDEPSNPTELLEAWPQPAADQPAPFFIVGAERSGTTLFRLLLSSHPEIACHTEFEYAVDWLDPKTGTLPLNEYRDRLVEHRKFPELFKVREMLEEHPQIEVDHTMLVRAFLEQYRREQGRPVIGATIHRHFDRVLNIWPNARFIHIVRDPRDVARSNVKMGWAGTPYHGIGGWVHAEKLWDDLLTRIDPERCIDTQFEKLIESPVDELTRISTFLGLEFSEKMLNFHETSTYSPLDPTMTWQWKRKMRPIDIRLVEGRLGGMLCERGYEPSGHKPLHPSAVRRGWLAITGRAHKLNWRFNRYGMRLVLTNFVARKLHWKSVADRSRRAMQDIDQRLLK